MSLMLSVLLLPFASYVAALPFIQDEWGINNTQAGVVFSAFQAGFAASALLVIPLTDRLSARHILVASAAACAVGNALFPLAAQDIVTGSLLRALAGAGLVGVYVPGLRVISERFADKGRGMAMGLFVTAFYAGNGVSLVATGWLLNRLDWQDAYLVLSLASFASLPLAWVLLRGQRPSLKAGSSSGRLDVSVLRNRPSRVYIFGYTMHAAELYIVRGWLPAFLTAVLVTRGMGHEQAVTTGAAVGGLALGLGALGPVMGGLVSDRLGRATSAAAIFCVERPVLVGDGMAGRLSVAAGRRRRDRVRLGHRRGLGNLHHRCHGGRRAGAAWLHHGHAVVPWLHGRRGRADCCRRSAGPRPGIHRVGRGVLRHRPAGGGGTGGTAAGEGAARRCTIYEDPM